MPAVCRTRMLDIQWETCVLIDRLHLALCHPGMYLGFHQGRLFHAKQPLVGRTQSRKQLAQVAVPSAKLVDVLCGVSLLLGSRFAHCFALKLSLRESGLIGLQSTVRVSILLTVCVFRVQCPFGFGNLALISATYPEPCLVDHLMPNAFTDKWFSELHRTAALYTPLHFFSLDNF